MVGAAGARAERGAGPCGVPARDGLDFSSREDGACRDRFYARRSARAGHRAPRSGPDAPPQAKSRFVAVLPFGSGQFQNGQATKGAVLAALDSVALATGVIGLALFESQKTSGGFLAGGTFKDPDLASTYQDLYVGGLLVFAGLWIYGAVDGLRHFDAPASVTVTPNGGTWGFAF